MTHHDIREAIIVLAKDMCRFKTKPQRTNGSRDKAFRFPGEEAPFGFEFNGVDIEVHVTSKMTRVPGTVTFVRAPVLTIYGIAKDGRGHLIADKVMAGGVQS